MGLLDLERMKEAKRGFLMNFRKGAKAEAGAFEADHPVSPPDGVDLMEGTGATLEEMIAHYRWEGRRDWSYTAMLHRAANVGLAVEYGMHEVNSETYQINYRLREVMKNLPDESKDRALLEDALKGVERFRSILSTMNTYSDGSLGRRGVPGPDVLKQVNDILGEALKRWNVTLTASDAFLECKVPGLEKYSVPAFINLIRNAFYWTGQSDRERRIHLDASPVEFEPYEDGTPHVEWVVSISDSGPGVDPAMSEVIFEPFRSGRRSTGIGLYLCRQVLARERATVIVAPEPSELGGATFLVGPTSVLNPAPALPPSMKERLRVEAIGIAQLVIDGKTRELVEFYGEQYAELSREALRVRLEGPQDDDDRFLLRLADGIEDVLRSRSTPEELQGIVDEELGVDVTAPPRI